VAGQQRVAIVPRSVCSHFFAESENSPHRICCEYSVRYVKRNMFFTTSSYAVILLLSLLQTSCLSFSPPPLLSGRQQQRIIISSSSKSTSSLRQHLSPLNAVTKKQTFILDGAELSHYIQRLAADHNINSDQNNDSESREAAAAVKVPDVAPRSLEKRKRVASISFVTAVLDEQIVLQGDKIIDKGAKIIGIEVPKDHSSSDSRATTITIDKDVQLYQDSIAIVPPSLKVSDADIISTAATSLLGVHSSTKRKRAVIIGGGDYAIFLAKALVALNVKTYLVTARPAWSLPSPKDIAGSSSSSSSSKDLIEIMPPAVGSMSLGFAMAIGEFDVLIDTLGDEMGMGRARTIVSNDGYAIGQSSLQQWKELHGCSEYISTLTRSQQYVLGKGLLFARDSVIRYQREVESKSSTASPKGVIPSVPPPRNFGATVQSLLNQNVVYPAGSNEVGSQGKKSTFVRGWSLTDLTEMKSWPRASEGAGRFGFPMIDLKARRIRPVKETKKDNAPVAEKIAADDATKHDAVVAVASPTSELLTSSESMMETTTNATSTKQIKVITNKSTTKNPYVTTIHSASELNQNIVEARRNCILFLTASYCQKCKRLTPQFQRMARKSSESTDAASKTKNNAVSFAHVDISAGPKGKQLGKLLNVEKVPSVIIFRNGKQVEIDAGEKSSIVVERGNLNRLEKVADALERGEKDLKLKDLMAVEEAIQK
jgi:thiol-disulfide isomerase/thioredoxin